MEETTLLSHLHRTLEDSNNGMEKNNKIGIRNKFYLKHI